MIRLPFKSFCSNNKVQTKSHCAHFHSSSLLDSSVRHLIPSLPCLALINSLYYVPQWGVYCLFKVYLTSSDCGFSLSQQKVNRMRLKSVALGNSRHSAQWGKNTHHFQVQNKHLRECVVKRSVMGEKNRIVLDPGMSFRRGYTGNS